MEEMTEKTPDYVRHEAKSSFKGSDGKDYWNSNLEIAENIGKAVQNDKEIAEHLFLLNSSMSLSEYIEVIGPLSEYAIQGQEKSRNNDIANIFKTSTVTNSKLDVKGIFHPTIGKENKITEDPKVYVLFDTLSDRDTLHQTDGILDIEDISLTGKDDKVLDEAARKEVDDVTDDDGDIFGILSIYKESDMHFEINKVRPFIVITDNRYITLHI